MSGELVTLSLCGDVMLGRGVDQALPNPGDPALRELDIRDAGAYVELASVVNGRVPVPVDFAWPWGEALQVLDDFGPDVRVLNLETSVTRSDDFAQDKGIHYRMSPANLPCLTAVRPDVCVLANNHVLDFGRSGLAETLDALAAEGLRVAGAGRDVRRARHPAIVQVGGGGGGEGGSGDGERRGRVLTFSMGTPSSGIPGTWAATADRSGVDFLPELSDAAAAEVSGRVRELKRRGDIVVVSVHWGSNWGYDVPPEQVRFAHALIDGGADVVHGHSSHHPRPLEVYRDRLVLYGCGDFIDDYEGIADHGQYRDDLRLLYLVSVEAGTGRLAALRMAPFQARRMRLAHASREDTAWLRAVLEGISGDFGVRVDSDPDGMLTLRTGESQPCRD